MPACTIPRSSQRRRRGIADRRHHLGHPGRGDPEFGVGRRRDSPMGDGMILGCLLLAFPLWPITMPLWLLYLVKRHNDQKSWRSR